jgi:tripeptide aminopeptidase
MNIDKLLEILSVQSHSKKQFRMFAKIVRELSTIENIRMKLNEGNLYVIKGEAEIYPCMVSHMDTVHPIKKDLYPLVFGDYITGFDRIKMKQTGIGGDDKVGVFITLECLRQFDNFKAVFFRDEEIGCVGSYRANMSFFEDCSFVLQCDRRGSEDFVIDTSVEMSGDEFQDEVLPIIKQFGYKFSDGMMTDVMALKQNGLKVACANMSCGYHRPHCDDETVCISQVENCLEMCFQLFRTLGHFQFVHHVPARERFNRNVWDKKKDDVAARDLIRKYGLNNLLESDGYGWIRGKDGEWIRAEEEESFADEKTCQWCDSVMEPEYSKALGDDYYCHTCGMYDSDIAAYMEDADEMPPYSPPRKTIKLDAEKVKDTPF